MAGDRTNYPGRPLGASVPDQALVASDQAAARLAPTGFDPSRIGELIAAEEFIAASLTDAYQMGKLYYAHYSPAHDATVARLVALYAIAEAIATEARRAETAQTGSVHEGAGRQASPESPSR